jgi:hypothetical protein
VATKKQKRERLAARRAEREAELKREGLEAQRRDREQRALKKQMSQRENTPADIRKKGAAAVSKIIAKQKNARSRPMTIDEIDNAFPESEGINLTREQSA